MTLPFDVPNARHRLGSDSLGLDRWTLQGFVPHLFYDLPLLTSRTRSTSRTKMRRACMNPLETTINFMKSSNFNAMTCGDHLDNCNCSLYYRSAIHFNPHVRLGILESIREASLVELAPMPWGNIFVPTPKMQRTLLDCPLHKRFSWFRSKFSEHSTIAQVNAQGWLSPTFMIAFPLNQNPFDDTN